MSCLTNLQNNSLVTIIKYSNDCTYSDPYRLSCPKHIQITIHKKIAIIGLKKDTVHEYIM